MNIFWEGGKFFDVWDGPITPTEWGLVNYAL